MKNRKIVLSSWIQERCKLCQKWLGRKQKEYCTKCAIKHRLDYYKEYYQEHPQKKQWRNNHIERARETERNCKLRKRMKEIN